MKIDYQSLEKKINTDFKNKDLLIKALTHKSYNKENNNEKLQAEGMKALGSYSAMRRYMFDALRYSALAFKNEDTIISASAKLDVPKKAIPFIPPPPIHNVSIIINKVY